MYPTPYEHKTAIQKEQLHPIEDVRISQKELLDALHITRSTLIMWERRGFLLPYATEAGVRYYTEDHIDAITLYKHLKPIAMKDAASALGVSTGVLATWRKTGYAPDYRDFEGKPLYHARFVERMLEIEHTYHQEKDRYNRQRTLYRYLCVQAENQHIPLEALKAFRLSDLSSIPDVHVYFQKGFRGRRKRRAQK